MSGVGSGVLICLDFWRRLVNCGRLHHYPMPSNSQKQCRRGAGMAGAPGMARTTVDASSFAKGAEARCWSRFCKLASFFFPVAFLRESCSVSSEINSPYHL